MDRRRRFQRAEMYVPGLAVKHELARQDRDLEEACRRSLRHPELVRKNMLESAYREIAGLKGMARMHREDEVYKAKRHPLRYFRDRQ